MTDDWETQWAKASEKGPAAVARLVAKRLLADPKMLRGLVFVITDETFADGREHHDVGVWADLKHLGCVADVCDEVVQRQRAKEPPQVGFA